MKRVIPALLLAAALLLTGCASLLDREYSSVEPHSEKYWESEDSSVLRAGDYQELVNDILTIVASHAEKGSIRIYTKETAPTVETMVEEACSEVQTETAAGAYAVGYITYTTAAGADYREVRLRVSYRRTAEQQAAVVNVTSSSAIPDLLAGAAAANKSELVLRIKYFSDTEEEIRALVRQEDEKRNGDAAGSWTVNFYPDAGETRIIEILLTRESG